LPCLSGNRLLGDEGAAALVAPPPPSPTGALTEPLALSAAGSGSLRSLSSLGVRADVLLAAVPPALAAVARFSRSTVPAPGDCVAFFARWEWWATVVDGACE